MPWLPLSAMVLPAAGVGPPMRAPAALTWTRIPSPEPLPIGAMPLASVPIRLPCTMASVPLICTPPRALPEITLPAPAVAPPIVPDGPFSWMPYPPLLRSVVPATSVPTWLLVAWALAPESTTPAPANRLMARPRTALSSAVSSSPIAPAPAFVPSTSTTGVAV